MIFEQIYLLINGMELRRRQEIVAQQHKAMLAAKKQMLAAYRAEGLRNLASLRERMHSPQAHKPFTTNCKNCGAPHEPVCSYCGTKP